VKLQRDEWDEEERRALKGVEQELEQLRARHGGDPPFELLRAADAEALPDSLQTSLAEHLKQSAWSRALVEGASEPSADSDVERRLLARIKRSAGSTASSRWRSWVPVLAAAAVLVVMVGVLRRREPARPPDQQARPTAGAPAASSAQPAVVVLPLDKPGVKLTPQALVLRSDARGARFADDIAPALTAYNENNYGEADRQFAALQKRYPQSVEVVFYRGIAQLFLNDPPGAIVSLQAARRLDDDAFAGEIAWYLAVAYDRAGDQPRARAELEALCRRTDAYASRACEAAAKRKPE